MHKPFQSKAYIEATFEDPTHPSDPIVVPAIQLQPEPPETFEHPRYYFLSPALGALDCKLYDIKITAYKDKTRQQVLTEHKNQLLSRINSDSCVKSEFIEKMRAAASYADWQEN